MNRHAMKPFLAVLVLVLIVLPEVAYSQTKHKRVTIMKNEKEEYFKGYLVGINDSTLFLSEDKFGRELIPILYRSIYSVKPGRKPGKGALIGAITGSLIGAVIGGSFDIANDAVNFTGYVVSGGQYQGEQTNYVIPGILVGMLAGSLTGAIIEGNSYNKPIMVVYSKEIFTEVQPILKSYLPKSKR